MVDRRPQQKLQSVDVLGDCRPLAREIGLCSGEDLLGLVEVSARRNSTSKPDLRQLNALLRARRSLLSDQAETGIRGIVEPGGGDIRDQRETRCAGPSFGQI